MLTYKVRHILFFKSLVNPLKSLVYNLLFILQMGISPDTARSAVMGIQMVLSQVNETEDRSSTNLDTVEITFRKLVDENNNISIDEDILESATVILSDIQGWGMDNSSLETLQNTSAE